MDSSTAPPQAAAVLELRVHGINNTTAPALLDLRPQDVELVAGDKLGSFWRPTPAAVSALEQGQRGYVPPGIVREAYSWGGMVRSTPDLGSAGAAGMLAGAIARVFYALILPFSLANAAQWTWRLAPTSGSERGVGRFAGLTRLFGLLLTLLFTCTTATLALDVGALQCAADTARCAPVASLLAPLEAWTAGQRLALFAMIPVAAIGVLWLLSVVSQLRYDVLPGMASRTAPESTRAAAKTTALLAQPGFWSNHRTQRLARLHLAAGVLLTGLLVAAHAALTWHSDCRGLGIDPACLGDAAGSGSFWLFGVLAVVCALGLAITVVLTVAVPTADVATEEESAATWPQRWSLAVLVTAFAVFVVLLVALLFDRSGGSGPARLYGAGATPLIIATAAGLIALSGVVWRPWAGRSHVAWRGCAPAVLMTLALAMATATSAVVVVAVGDWLNGAPGAAALVRDASLPAGAAASLTLSSFWMALGAALLLGLIAALVWVGVALLRGRDVRERVQAWGAPGGPDGVHVPSGGVLPPSPATLFSRIAAKRRVAARVHLVEPLAGALIAWLGVALLLGTVWAWAAYLQKVSLWAILPALSADAIRTFLAVSLPALAWIGAALVAVLALGAAGGRSRPLGLVWDIVCYLPRTGHPFGPPSYAERAVPEIAGRLFAWLDADPARRAVLAAHSMGGVLAVSALGVLAAAPTTRPVLARVSLLTFGVQLRAFFGRMLPELLGPEVLGTEPALAPRVRDADPWHADYAAQGGTTASGAAPTAPGRLTGALLASGGVAWLNLWRPTDYLGFPAVSTSRADPPRGFVNQVDRVAEELDLSGYMVEVGAHGEYYRAPTYARALDDLLQR